MSGPVCQTCLDARWLYGAGEWVRCPDCNAEELPPIGDGLGPFIAYTEAAKQELTPSKTNWAGSPFAWMQHNSPREKSKMARRILREWLRASETSWERPEQGPAHFLIAGRLVYVHLGIQGKNAKLEFSQLRDPGNGVDVMYLIGVEPRRARIWEVSPEAVSDLPSYQEQHEIYHHCTFAPDEIPDWAREIACWNGAS